MPSIRMLLYKLRRRGVADSLAFARRKCRIRLAKAFPQAMLGILRIDDLAAAAIDDLLAMHRQPLQDRTCARFHFEPNEIPSIVAAIPKELREKTVRDADEVMKHHFCFRGVSQHFAGEVDWNIKPSGEGAWRWDLNRHVFLVDLACAHWYSGRADYVAKIEELVLHWRARNPCDLNAPNWCDAFETAARLNNWIWVFFLLRGSDAASPQLLAALLNGIHKHAQCLFHFIETDIPNNHLFLEAKALYEAGVVLAPLRVAAKWRRKGARHLAREFKGQVRRDGGHSEQSMTYQRIVNAEAFEAMLLARRNADAEMERTLGSRLLAMAECTGALVRPDGSFPVLGDATTYNTYYRFNPMMIAASVFERPDLKAVAVLAGENDLSYFLLGSDGIAKYDAPRSVSPQRRSLPFPQTGCFIMEDEAQGLHAVIDCGAFCDEEIPAHGHDDILGFDLTLRNTPFIVDSGSAEMTETAADALTWRSYFRGPTAHNVVVVDGLHRTRLTGWRDVGRMAKPLACRWHADDRIDVLSGAHDGYWTSLGVLHQRHFLLIKGRFLCIIDRLLGQGEHRFESLLHLAPDLKAAVQEKGEISIFAGESRFANMHFFGVEGSATVVRGQRNPAQGWVSFASGAVTESDVVCFASRTALPRWFGTLIQDAEGEQAKVVLQTDGPRSGHGLPAFRVSQSDAVYDVRFVAASESGGSPGGGLHDRLMVAKLQGAISETLYESWDADS